MQLPDLLPLDTDEQGAQTYIARLAEACAPILVNPPPLQPDNPIYFARFWLAYLAPIEYGPATRADLARRLGESILNEAAARQALALWRGVEAWHAAHLARDPRYALRHLMSDLSEDAYCAS